VTPRLLSRGKRSLLFTMTPTIALPSLYREAVTSLASGKSPETVLEDLVHKGLPEMYARGLISDALSESGTMAANG
jgi:hypothetical protein